MEKVKVWRWFAIVLVILNIALCISVGLQLNAKKSTPNCKPNDFIISNLHFNANQIGQFEKLRAAHHDSVEVLLKEGRELRKLYFSNLKASHDLNLNVDSLQVAIGRNQQQIEKVTFNHFAQLRNICNEEQKKTFDGIIDEILRRVMNNNRPGAGAPPPRLDGPPPPADDVPPPPPDRN